MTKERLQSSRPGWRNFVLLYGAGLGTLLLATSALKLLFAALIA